MDVIFISQPAEGCPDTILHPRLPRSDSLRLKRGAFQRFGIRRPRYDFLAIHQKLVKEYDNHQSKWTPISRLEAEANEKLADVYQLVLQPRVDRTMASKLTSLSWATKSVVCELFNKAYVHISDRIDEVYKDLTKDSEEPYAAGIKYHAMPHLSPPLTAAKCWPRKYLLLLTQRALVGSLVVSRGPLTPDMSDRQAWPVVRG
ncbi:hypothetical protein BU15DRAFT_65917 [Melanogaster broomeanus]|nr:hypothetical protein BU15DRAFT_65917 [Melanogaster broomeanus]